VIRIAITEAAYRAIEATMPLGSVGFERDPAASGEVFVWLEEGVLNRLRMMRGSGESYSDVILRLATARRRKDDRRVVSGLRTPSDTGEGQRASGRCAGGAARHRGEATWRAGIAP
jgi:hypothetical protein